MYRRQVLLTLLFTCIGVQTTIAEDEPLTIVTLGDSITKGIRTGVTADETFASLTEASLVAEGMSCKVINVGIGGERTDQALRRLDEIIALKPQVVTVMYGTNDSYVDPGRVASRITVEEYTSNLQEIVTRLLLAGIQPILMTEPRWAADAGLNGLDEHPDLRLAHYVDACRDVADQLGVPLVDHFAHWTVAESQGQTLRDWTTDGCHPNPIGHRELTQVMLPILKVAVSQTGEQRPAVSEVASTLLSGSEPVRVVCFGDSVTGLYYHTGGRRAYTDLLGIALRRLCPRAVITTINAGISGHTTRDALARIDKDVLDQKPSLVTVMFGLNDMTRVPLDEYRTNLKTIIEKCRGVGAKVVLCTPNSVITTDSRPVEKLEQYCDIVREVAAEKNVPLCDTYAAYQALREQDPLAWRLLMSDEIHPNHDGHKVIAEHIAQTITGRKTSLARVAPLRPATPHTFAKLRAGEPIKVLAMPPFDQSVSETIQQIAPDASVEVVPWNVDGKSVRDLEQDANSQVRALKPDLVVIAVPRSASAASEEEFIRSFAWIMNWSLSFGRQEWDVLVVHLDVVEPAEGEHDDLIRKLVAAQDLTLIDRSQDNEADAATIFSDWLRQEWPVLPEVNGAVEIPAQEWPRRPGPRNVRTLIHYPGGRLDNVNEQTGLMLTLHNWGGTDCVGTADPTRLADELNVVAICVNYLQSGRQASIEDPEPYDCGYLQALDALRALHFVFDRLQQAQRPFHAGRIYATGGSGGGNVSLMANKLAPTTFACIIDMCGMARLTDDIAYDLPGGSPLNARWSRNPESPNYLATDAQEIRFIGNPSHLSVMEEHGSTSRIVVVHGEDDAMCLPEDKREMVANMQTARLTVEPHWITTDDVDGTVFTTSGHSLGDRTAIVFQVAGKYLRPDSPDAIVRPGPTNFETRDVAVHYPTTNGEYVISYQQGYPTGRFQSRASTRN
ncbi:MAG: DUF2920 family protein [Planctomycetaceae bacterium]|nr:DUF2920 family protein [Planctomycetaceae bacterium]